MAVEEFLGWIAGIATERLRPNSFLRVERLVCGPSIMYGLDFRTARAKGE